MASGTDILARGMAGKALQTLLTKADLVNGKVPESQLPSYVDDVIEVANYEALPVPGESGKIYVTLDNNKTYRWSGSTYIRIGGEELLPCIFGSTTYTSITAALADNRLPFCVYSNVLYILSSQGTDTYYFTAITSHTEKTLAVSSTDTWSIGTDFVNQEHLTAGVGINLDDNTVTCTLPALGYVEG